MDTEKGTIVTPGDVVGCEKKREDIEEFLVKESFVPTHHNDQHQAKKKMVVMRRRKTKGQKPEQSLPSMFCEWVVEHQLGMSMPRKLSGRGRP
jgi:hypothetical protein